MSIWTTLRSKVKVKYHSPIKYGSLTAICIMGHWYVIRLSLLWLPPPNFFDDFMFVEYIFAILFLYMIISLLWCPNLADTSNKHNIFEFNKQINIFLGLTTVFNLFFNYWIINFLKETGKLNTSIKHNILGFNNKSNLGFNIKSKTNYLRGTWNFEYERTYLKVKSKYWENIGREIIEA